MNTTVLENPSVAELPLKALTERYNSYAALLGTPTVNRFADRAAALKRLAKITEEAEAKFRTTRKKRQKVFSYPAADVLKVLKSGTLRCEARDALLKGASLGKIEELIADWDVRNGGTPQRLEPRAYGLVRLLHTYVGYALREEGDGPHKIIYAMDKPTWLAWKEAQKAQKTA